MPQPTPARGWKSHAVPCGLILTVTVGLYFPVLGFDFVNWDDPLYVTDNSIVQSGLNAASLRYAWTTLDHGNWLPLTWMSYLVDITLFGQNPQALHVVNLFWHAVNGCLVYFVLQRLTAAPGRSFIVALLFAVHPLHVESVAWIAERKDVLSTFFLLTTLLAYEHHARAPSGRRLALVILSFSLGLMSKSMVVTLPVLLLLVDVWPLRRIAGRDEGSGAHAVYPTRSFRRLLLEKAPLFALSLAVGVLTVAAQKATTAVGTLQTFPVRIRVGNAINAYAWYLLKTFIPTDLCAMYTHPLSALSWHTVALSGAALSAVAALVWRLRCRPEVVFGTLWFVLSLLPVIGLLQVGSQAWADRYTYIPHIGLFVTVVWALHDLLVPRIGRGPSIVVATAAIAACGVLSSRQIATWRNSETLWAQVLRVDPDNPTAHYQTGWELLQKEDYKAAQPYFERALTRRPNDAHSLVSLGMVHHNLGNSEEARNHYELALRIDPKYVLARESLQKLNQASPPRTTDQPKTPDLPRAAILANETGLTMARTGRIDEAVRHFREAIDAAPGFADAHNNLGMLLIQTGRAKDARQPFERAVAADPKNADFRFNLAQLLESLDDLPAARTHYQAVLELRPGDVEARLYLEQINRKLKK